MTGIETYKLSDRPRWWLPRLFKWLAVILAAISVVTWLVSSWLYSRITFDSVDIGEGNEETLSEMAASYLEEASVLLFDTLFIVAFLWLVAIAVDKLDQLVWLNATNEDREDILQKRKKKKNAKN